MDSAVLLVFRGALILKDLASLGERIGGFPTRRFLRCEVSLPGGFDHRLLLLLLTSTSVRLLRSRGGWVGGLHGGKGQVSGMLESGLRC